MTLYQCEALVTMDGPPIRDAAFIVERDRFTAIGSAGELLPSFTGRVVDLGSGIVTPGLINAHCHLEYSLMRGAILPSRSFAHWVGRINALKRELSDEDYLRGIAFGLTELRRNGVTSVYNVVASPQILPLLGPPPIRTWHFLELIDIRPRPWTDSYAFGAWMCFEPPRSSLQTFGLSPHAPYTASSGVFKLAKTCAEKLGLPITVHVSESQEEYAMFARREGPLFDFLSKMGRSMEDCGKNSPFRRLACDGLLSKESILVHMNELDEQDFACLQRPEWSQLSIVHCPKSHRFLHHRPFSLERLRATGLAICLGTDSLASNDSLNLFAEMRLLRRNYPWLTATELFSMCTVFPARAIGLADGLGKIAPGFLADAILVPASNRPDNFYEAIIENRKPIPWMMVNGREVQ
jgi:cytosine/adenosine deaminase-related metal-dependent hydrolase